MKGFLLTNSRTQNTIFGWESIKLYDDFRLLFNGFSILNDEKNEWVVLADNAFLNNDNNYSLLKQTLLDNQFSVERLEKNFDEFLSFLVVNIKTKTIYAYRDITGGRHFYYYKNCDVLCLSSHFNLLLEQFPNSTFDLNYDILPMYFWYGYISAPNTIFKQIRKLRPGEEFSFNSDTIVEKKNDFYDFFVDAKKSHCDDLKALLVDSINSNINSKEKVSSFMSGGIDSSLVSILLQKDSGRSESRAFTVGFDNKKQDESIFAEKVSSLLNMNHTTIKLPFEPAFEIIKKIPDIYGEPYADSSQIATCFAYDNCKDADLVLIGDGGDEFFYGYKSFVYARKAQLLLPFIKVFNFFVRKGKFANLDLNKSRYYLLYSFLNEKNVLKLFKNSENYQINFQYNPNEKKLKNATHRIALNFQSFSLSDDSVTKNLMPSDFYEINYCAPFMSKKIIKTSFNYQLKEKITKKYGGKTPLKQILFSYVDREYFDRPKHGFAVPLDDWFNKEDFVNLIRPLFSEEYIRGQDIFDFDYLNKQFTFYCLDTNKENVSIQKYREFFTIVVFQLWYDKYHKYIKGSFLND